MNIVSPDDIAQSIILLLNTIYFNGYWLRPFPENQTAEMDFSFKPNQAIKVPFMVNTADYYYFESTELDSKILRLPYKVCQMVCERLALFATTDNLISIVA